MDNRSFLAEFVEGGSGCIRDDCDVRADRPSTIEMKINSREPIITKHNRCLSCGKSWTERYQNDIRIK